LERSWRRTRNIQPAFPALEDFEDPFTNAHVLAEILATLTGFYKVPADTAAALILSLRDSVEVHALALGDYERAIRETRSRGVMGGGIYDSLHATFARRHKAVRIVTRNPSHFDMWRRTSKFLRL
jgi:hypothetical protein